MRTDVSRATMAFDGYLANKETDALHRFFVCPHGVGTRPADDEVKIFYFATYGHLLVF